VDQLLKVHLKDLNNRFLKLKSEKEELAKHLKIHENFIEIQALRIKELEDKLKQ
jgi:hypothetical protein